MPGLRPGPEHLTFVASVTSCTGTLKGLPEQGDAEGQQLCETEWMASRGSQCSPSRPAPLTWYLVATVGDIEAVSASLIGDVLDRAAAILVIHARHLGLRGALHSEA